MATVKNYRLKLARFEQTNESQRIVMDSVVSDLAPAADDAILFQALIEAGVPQIGDAHPHAPNAKVSRVNILPVTDTQVRMEVVYETPSRPTGPVGGKVFIIRQKTHLVGEQWQMSAGGYPIQAEYQPAGAATTFKHTATVNKLIPLRTLSVSVIQRDPLEAAVEDAVGMVNSTTWRGKDPATWLFVDADQETSTGGYSYQISLQFIHNPRSWDAFVVFRDSKGKIPSDVAQLTAVSATRAFTNDLVKARGLTRAKLYDETDFNTLFTF